MKEFFNIKKEYTFEIFDFTALLTVLNVALIVMGFSWAPILGVVNCGVNLVLCVKSRSHINTYITQIALIILNIYFLKG